MDVEVGGVAGQLYHPVSQTLPLFYYCVEGTSGSCFGGCECCDTQLVKALQGL